MTSKVQIMHMLCKCSSCFGREQEVGFVIRLDGPAPEVFGECHVYSEAGSKICGQHRLHRCRVPSHARGSATRSRAVGVAAT